MHQHQLRMKIQRKKWGEYAEEEEDEECTRNTNEEEPMGASSVGSHDSRS